MPTPRAGRSAQKSSRPEDTAARQLSRDAIIDASLTIARRGSDDAFTVRRIGAELGADPTSIYRHFRDKNELVRAVADQVLGEVVDAIPPDVDWKGRIRALAEKSAEVAAAYPVVAAALGHRTLRSKNEFRAMELILDALFEAGLSDGPAAVFSRLIGDVFYAMNGVAAGYLLLPDATRDADDLGWSREYRALKPADFPNIGRVRDLLDVEDATIRNALVDALIASVERSVASSREFEAPPGAAKS